MPQERIHAISPDEVAEEKARLFPGEVFQAFNELITQGFSGGRSVVFQNKVIARMVELGIERDDIIPNGWLDVEEVYRQNGWEVTYDAPGYNESYRPSFTFKRRRD